MAKYKLVKSSTSGEVVSVTLIEGNVHHSIPLAEDNSHYQEYKAWVDAGNTPDPADGPSDWDIARRKRDKLLKNSDWTMITGVTVDQAQWAAYRDKLREIPQTYKGKATSEIVWPTAPSTKGPNS